MKTPSLALLRSPLFGPQPAKIGRTLGPAVTLTTPALLAALDGLQRDTLTVAVQPAQQIPPVASVDAHFLEFRAAHVHKVVPGLEQLGVLGHVAADFGEKRLNIWHFRCRLDVAHNFRAIKPDLTRKPQHGIFW